MRIAVYSNAPWAPTGYGTQTGLLVPKLAERYGADNVAVLANFGLQGGPQRWHGVRIYPGGRTPFSDDVAPMHAEHFFDGQPGIVLTLFDSWVLTNPAWSDLNVASWVPIDHDPVPPGVLAWFDRTGALPIAMSRFGEKQLDEHGRPGRYVPHMIDRAVFYPQVPDRAAHSLPDNMFVVGMVAANKGRQPSRKGFAEAFLAFARFHRIHPDSVLYCHTDPFGFSDGINLLELAAACNLDDRAVIYTDPYQLALQYRPEQLANLYSSFDVLLSPSYGEGFGIPVIEAQACGIPVIVNDWTAQPELVGAGWTVGGQPWFDANQRSWFRTPNIDDIVDRLTVAYGRSARQIRADHQNATAKAAEYDQSRVWSDCWVPTLEACEDRLPPVSPLPEENSNGIHTR